jgi:hypothetical protein
MEAAEQEEIDWALGRYSELAGLTREAPHKRFRMALAQRAKRVERSAIVAQRMKRHIIRAE